MNGETAKSLKDTLIGHVMVEKANLPLLNDESIGEFNGKLDHAVTEHFRGLKLEKKPRYLYISELYTDKMVVDVGWAEESEEELRSPSTYYRLGYKRGPGGAFSFGTVEEVDRKTVWNTKSKVEKRLDDDFWNGVT